MRIDIEMTAQDHSVALRFLTEATPTHLNPHILDLFKRGTATGTDGGFRFEEQDHDLCELSWAMEQCVDLIECGSSKQVRDLDDAAISDHIEQLDGAAKRLLAACDDARSDVDHGSEEEAWGDDTNMVDCGPEYPRNDAGEWVGRM